MFSSDHRRGGPFDRFGGAAEVRAASSSGPSGRHARRDTFHRPCYGFALYSQEGTGAPGMRISVESFPERRGTRENVRLEEEALILPFPYEDDLLDTDI
ncbi:MAG: hypothetical protein AB7S92_09445 [Parvibaculaceae bacterium]